MFRFGFAFAAALDAPAIERQTHADQRAFAGRALERDRSAVQADKAAHHRQTEPGAFKMAIVIGARLEERLAELREIFRRDADPGIGNEDFQRIAFGLKVDRDAAAAAA